MSSTSILSVLGNDRNLIPYRKELRGLTKNFIATILLTQILYWWEKHDQKPFYKYKLPLAAKQDDETDEEYNARTKYYKQGDSWCEELNITKTEFDTALDCIAHKKDEKKEEDKKNPDNYPLRPFIEYYTTRERLTYYTIIDPKQLSLVISDYVKQESCFSKIRNPELTKAGTLTQNITETTTEPTAERVSKETQSGLPTTSGMSKRELLKQVKHEPRTRTTQELTNTLVSTIAIIDKWNEQESLPTHSKGTKTYANITKHLESLFKGTFFNNIPEFSRYKNYKFKRAEIMEAIRRHALVATSADYLPVNKKCLRISLDNFLFNNYGQSADSCSWFIYWLENEPKLVAEKRGEQILAKDKNIDITKMLKTWYSDVIMKGNNGHYSTSDIMNFVSASQKIKEFAEHKGKKIENVGYWIGMHDCQNLTELIAKLTMEMLEEYSNKTSKKIGTHLLSLDRTYKEFLPEYLKETAYI